MKSNRIPRQFYRIIVECNIETNFTKSGDILYIYRNDCGLLALNTRTGKYGYIFMTMIRNPEIIKIIDIIQ